jgi:GMP reductase
MRIITETKLDFKDVLIQPKRSTLKSRDDVNLERHLTFKHSKHTWTGVPIVASNMDHVGTRTMASSLNKFGLMVALTKHHTPDQLKEFFLSGNDTSLLNNWFSIGTNPHDLQKLVEFMQVARDMNVSSKVKVCIDVANGYSEHFVNLIKDVRSMFNEITIMAGNVVTPEMTEQLILSGADVVKCGIGSGAQCSTRIVTGVGYPQLSAIIESADAAHGLKGLICSDGGCSTPGDIVKAFGAGADFVMIGSMLAAHKEGEYDNIDGGYCEFYGMSSKKAQTLHNGGLKNYRASEGRLSYIPYRGEVSDTIQQILGGLRSACTYVGAKELKEFSKRTTFIRVNQTHETTYSDPKGTSTSH